ncbi:AcrR family transcriptional regulator [Pseudarthrobacter siccitolerans]|uniref:AcrR family transcriptional regulator n=1 Tax=Pseudarthrobacter siccitolerans TaxID=861266 RepID=A0ABU0PKJ9_9MICC|nr:TetR/AcrR family transcriptional regulator [Pseudarthrobacter siccitolerans]MDQ0674465.1 AcrR family transcriptional regulator [Pseudarthrobacter siccitolerans]
MTSTRVPARQRLLEAADRLFYAEGVHTVGIDRVIEEAGVAKGSLFYNFSGKEELVAAYLAGRDQRRRDRIARYQQGLEDPVEKLLAMFDSLQEAVTEPGYKGCAFANANAEALPDSMEARALRTFRDWLSTMILALCQEAGFDDPAGVAARLELLYDGAVANSQLDAHTDAVRLAKELASMVLSASPKASQ